MRSGLLERLRRPRPIVLPSAPALAVAVDVTSSPRRPEQSEPSSTSLALRVAPAGACTALSAPGAHWTLPPSPPGYRPGICHHPGHVVLDGERFGVLPLSFERVPSSAALTRCHHDNPAGC